MTWQDWHIAFESTFAVHNMDLEAFALDDILTAQIAQLLPTYPRGLQEFNQLGPICRLKMSIVLFWFRGTW